LAAERDRVTVGTDDDAADMLDDDSVARVGREVSDARERRSARDEVDVHGEACLHIDPLSGRWVDVGLGRLDAADLNDRIVSRIEPGGDAPFVVARKRPGEGAAVEAAGEWIAERERTSGRLPGAGV